MPCDKKVTAGLKTGYQPAEFRLQTGKCFVGALAHSLSPQQTGTRKMVGKSRIAEVQILKGQKNESGRNRDRIRRQYRKAHQAELKESEDICVGTWNAQGADWSQTEERHVAKFVCLVEGMREREKYRRNVLDGSAWEDG